MLFSGDRVARFVLFREFFNLASKPIDWLLQPFEKRLLKQTANDTAPKIFVVGGSRSGTTIVYQTLAHYLPVSYFST